MNTAQILVTGQIEFSGKRINNLTNKKLINKYKKYFEQHQVLKGNTPAHMQASREVFSANVEKLTNVLAKDLEKNKNKSRKLSSNVKASLEAQKTATQATVVEQETL